MKGKTFQPQILQMDADGLWNPIICENLRHLRLNHYTAKETDKALREILERVGV